AWGGDSRNRVDERDHGRSNRANGGRAGSQQSLHWRLPGGDRRQRSRARNRDQRRVEKPNGSLALDCYRLKRASGSLRGAGSRARESVHCPAPMDLAFPAGLVLAVLLSVLITGQVAGDGRSDWLKDMQLLAVYLVLGLTFFFLPSTSPSH